jgi:hypothetical protein
MTRKPERKPDDQAQYKRFVEAADKAEADKTEEGADRAFKRIAQKSRGKDSSSNRAGR